MSQRDRRQLLILPPWPIGRLSHGVHVRDCDTSRGPGYVLKHSDCKYVTIRSSNPFLAREHISQVPFHRKRLRLLLEQWAVGVGA